MQSSWKERASYVFPAEESLAGPMLLVSNPPSPTTYLYAASCPLSSFVRLCSVAATAETKNASLYRTRVHSVSITTRYDRDLPNNQKFREAKQREQWSGFARKCYRYAFFLFSWFFFPRFIAPICFRPVNISRNWISQTRRTIYIYICLTFVATDIIKHELDIFTTSCIPNIYN